MVGAGEVLVDSWLIGRLRDYEAEMAGYAKTEEYAQARVAACWGLLWRLEDGFLDSTVTA